MIYAIILCCVVSFLFIMFITNLHTYYYVKTIETSYYAKVLAFISGILFILCLPLLWYLTLIQIKQYINLLIEVTKTNLFLA